MFYKFKKMLGYKKRIFEIFGLSYFYKTIKVQKLNIVFSHFLIERFCLCLQWRSGTLTKI